MKEGLDGTPVSTRSPAAASLGQDREGGGAARTQPLPSAVAGRHSRRGWPRTAAEFSPWCLPPSPSHSSLSPGRHPVPSRCQAPSCQGGQCPINSSARRCVRLSRRRRGPRCGAGRGGGAGARPSPAAPRAPRSWERAPPAAEVDLGRPCRAPLVGEARSLGSAHPGRDHGLAGWRGVRPAWAGPRGRSLVPRPSPRGGL